jgi:hypothetical protein
VGAEGLEPPTPCVWSTAPGAKTGSDDPVARNPRIVVTGSCHAVPSGGTIDLSAALRALADAGLPPDALAAAVEALMRAARTEPATPLRRVERA